MFHLHVHEKSTPKKYVKLVAPYHSGNVLFWGYEPVGYGLTVRSCEGERPSLCAFHVHPQRPLGIHVFGLIIVRREIYVHIRAGRNIDILEPEMKIRPFGGRGGGTN